jgi:peptide/nickel transport system ATP-binding protein/oligopeptide transport system ATP-binding protein
MLTGDVPNPANPPQGCAFHPRCPKAFDRCKKEAPKMIKLHENHFVSCHLFEGI